MKLKDSLDELFKCRLNKKKHLKYRKEHNIVLEISFNSFYGVKLNLKTDRQTAKFDTERMWDIYINNEWLDKFT